MPFSTLLELRKIGPAVLVLRAGNDSYYIKKWAEMSNKSAWSSQFYIFLQPRMYVTQKPLDVHC